MYLRSLTCIIQKQTILKANRFLFTLVLFLPLSVCEISHPWGANETDRVGAKNAWLVQQLTAPDREHAQVMEEWITGFVKTDLFQLPKP
jgi:hypothetical protein